MRRLTPWLAAMVIASSACAAGDGPLPSDPTIPPSPTLSDYLNRWLTTERQERLADLVATTAKVHGWAAGCVFRYNADESVLDEFSRPAGEAAYSFVNDPALRPAIVVYVEGKVKAGGSFREVLPGSSFCYVPE